ncbi:hypothetical protein BCR33DRAFT_813032 [Rhizoclosmatium globosum]|uniref:Uncharacterized protein n=1 Tax=Rhizoclosmatium globosum TaxID=329046 RepID=A0A1Y2CGF7_9FUNG|nr:hypothetical protein BCR33DRAFT_813032 [Rhizoclosmatium globosum]|eukprot:ORY46130.1 hypothetical protein BCR33DRAFT_813032 [Rhizoclosmatium globosum]
MAPQPPIFGPPTVYNFTGGAFERVFVNQFDCAGIPQPADLKCLDFSLTNFNYTRNYLEHYFLLCDFAQRFNATYGHPILSVSANGNVDSNGFVNRVDLRVTTSTGTSANSPDRRGKPIGTNCYLTYASSTAQFADVQYILAENQPVCGAKAPQINATAYPPYSFSVVNPDVKNGHFSFTFNYSPDNDMDLGLANLAAAYSVDVSSIVYKFISDTKFSLTVPAVPGDLSAVSSCVYNYDALLFPETKGRVYSLNKITQGTIPLKENATLSDGCLTSLIDAGRGSFTFTSTANDTCGQTDYSSRFGRYFNFKTYVLSMYVLSAGEITFNVSDTYKDGNYDRNDRRRDGLTDYSFNFVDKAAFATTATTATTVSTVSTVTPSSSVASSTVAKSASASGSAAASATVVVTTTAAAAVPTAYVAPANPTAYVAPAVPAYGAPANNNNNLYKGAAVEKVGIVAALVAAVFLA